MKQSSRLTNIIPVRSAKKRATSLIAGGAGTIQQEMGQRRIPPANEEQNEDEKGTVRVLLVDTHALMLKALQRVVASFAHASIVGLQNSTPEVGTVAARQEAEVIVLGISISVTESLQLLHDLAERSHPVAVIAIQPHLRPETVLALVKQGVQGLLDQYASEQDLADAITTVAGGGSFLSRHARELLATAMTRASVALTARELEVASLLLLGEPNIRIARKLGVKQKTVEAHLTSIYSKLGVASRTEAILGLQDLQM